MMVKIKQILKIIFYIILINSFENLNTEAHISHYKNLKKIEMEIFRNDKLIGYNYYFFKKNKKNRDYNYRNIYFVISFFEKNILINCISYY